MGYLALYREFRPQTFDEVIDQNHIVETLKNQVMNQKIGHAYLFCGTRGTGKTSCAKILAKAVNCLSPKNGSPCGECSVCKSIQSNGNLDIVEIDAASNNGVDQIRDLREKVNFLPSIAKYKGYIIYEVHMLTENAFNALLKTLEEPPEHIIFILATTEPEKIPATILSRCMRFDFKLVDLNCLTNHLKNIFNKIGLKFDDMAVELIAKAGKGSVRDTLSIAEMCKSFTEKKLTVNDVENCLGYTNSETINKIVQSIIKKDGGNIILEVENIYKNGKNLSVLIGEIAEYFKNVLITKLASGFDLNEPKEIIEDYKKISSVCDEKYLLDTLKILSSATTEIKYCDDQKSFVISTLLGLFYNQNIEIENLKNRISLLEQNLQNGQNLSKNTQNMPKIIDNSPNFDQNHQIIANVSKIDNSKSATEIFGELIKFSRETGEMILHQSFGDVERVKFENNKFIFVCKNDDIKNMINNRAQIVLNFLKTRYNISGIDFETEQKESNLLNELNAVLNGKVELKKEN